jgi:pyoverdine/dityrosine biosynthesis protein Dit1
MTTARLRGSVRSSSEQAARAIVDIIDGARKNPHGEVFDNSHLRSTLMAIIADNAPLRVVLPLFHGKCSSRRFTIGDLPDYAEYLAIETLAELHGRIADVYSATTFFLISEGHFHSEVDHFIGSDHIIEDYARGIREMLTPYPALLFKDTDDLLPGMTHEQQRRILLEQYSPDDDETRRMMLADVRLLALYRSYTKLHLKLITDRPVTDSSGRQQRGRAKQRALLQLRKYIGFARLLGETFGPNPYVKLSPLYKTPAQSDQLGINVIKGIHTLGTTSFNAVCKTRAGISLLSAEEARKAGYRLVPVPYPYFEE